MEEKWKRRGGEGNRNGTEGGEGAYRDTFPFLVSLFSLNMERMS